MIATTEQITINGVSLDSYAYMLPDTSGLLTVPARRGENVVVPGRHGEIRTPRKRYEANRITLQLWVVGANPDGSLPSGSTELREFTKRRDELLRIFAAETCQVVYTRADGSAVQATCEVKDIIDFTRKWADPLAQLSVRLDVFGAFWEDAATVSQTVTTGAAQTLTAFQGATAPMQDLVLTFTGATSNPMITHGSRYFKYNGVVSAGRQLVVPTTSWTPSTGTGSAWSPDMRQYEFGPGPSLFELDPTLPTFEVQYSHTGTGTPSMTISGRRRYLAP